MASAAVSVFHKITWSCHLPPQKKFTLDAAAKIQRAKEMYSDFPEIKKKTSKLV